jgi:uncharacterized protein (DUF488 family)
MIWTIGHSTRTVEALVALLTAHGIRRLADVRSFPRSRRHPQFNVDVLPGRLAEAGITYEHVPALGGFRRPRPDSVNTAWREPGFRGYADHMQTPEFGAAVDGLLARAATVPTAIMCAEAVPWRCHRQLLADALVARGESVAHVVSAAAATAHALTPTARVVGARVTYPGTPELFPRGAGEEPTPPARARRAVARGRRAGRSGSSPSRTP